MIEMIDSGELNATENIPNDQRAVQTSMTSITIRAMLASNEQPVYLRPPPPTHMSPRTCGDIPNDIGVLNSPRANVRGSTTEEEPIRR